MLTLRPAAERGHADFGWLDSYHSFSFGSYYDPAHMGFRNLRVINEDRVAPGQGFSTHSHRDMEIVTFVLDGVVEHKDSLGNVATIRPGELQRMTAGTGISHSEYNPSRTAGTHFLQIWIIPEAMNLQPGYEQAEFPAEKRLNQLTLIGSRDGRGGSVTIHQDVNLYTGLLEAGQEVSYTPDPARHLWLQVTRGSLLVNGQPAQAGDGAGISAADSLHFTATTNAEFLLFDLA
jgi:redox-sensitive bicupin YhaK (pirin superfamily)